MPTTTKKASTKDQVLELATRNAALYAAATARIAALENTGAQANVLEGVKVNGTALAIANKIVDILIAESATNGAIKVNNVDVAVHGLAAMAYKANVSQDDLDAALAQVIADKAAASDVTTLSATVSTLIGSDTNKSARTIANEELAAALIPENAKESLDTLAEIAAWIQSHPDDASAMNSAISALETILAGFGTGTGETATVAAALENKVDKVEGSRLMTSAEATKLDGITAGATKTEAGETEGTVKINGTEVTVVEFATDAEMTAAYDEIFGTSGD